MTRLSKNNILIFETQRHGGHRENKREFEFFHTSAPLSVFSVPLCLKLISTKTCYLEETAKGAKAAKINVTQPKVARH